MLPATSSFAVGGVRPDSASGLWDPGGFRRPDHRVGERLPFGRVAQPGQPKRRDPGQCLCPGGRIDLGGGQEVGEGTMREADAALVFPEFRVPSFRLDFVGVEIFD